MPAAAALSSRMLRHTWNSHVARRLVFSGGWMGSPAASKDNKHYDKNTMFNPTAAPMPDVTPRDMPEDPSCDPKHPLVLSYTQISKAATRLKGGILHSPCDRSAHLSAMTGMDIYLKKEFMQMTGSFKERGARMALLQLSEKEKKAGVFAASAGNHALALCYHGAQLGIPVTVVMPRHAPIVKIDRCNKMGANIHVEGKDISVSRKLCIEMANQAGGKYVNGYDHIDILAGAGTVGTEILDQVHDLDAIIVPAGGGGLLAGVATAVKSLYPDIKIVAVESETCSSFQNAMKAGRPTYTKCHPTLADGLAVPTVGVNAFETARDKVDKIVSVKEKDIALAVLRLVENEKAVVEGAGAIGIAALISGQLDEFKGKRVASILTGGNIDNSALTRCIERGMVYDNRLMRFSVVVSDRPGGTAELTQLIAKTGASIKDIGMERAWIRKDVFSVKMKVEVETRGRSHSQEIEKTIRGRYMEDSIFPEDHDMQ